MEDQHNKYELINSLISEYKGLEIKREKMDLLMSDSSLYFTEDINKFYIANEVRSCDIYRILLNNLNDKGLNKKMYKLEDQINSEYDKLDMLKKSKDFVIKRTKYTLKISIPESEIDN